jgi:hypothetical protein
MILHKMVFFKLPYRYANDGDGDDATGGGNEGEGEKMDKLEQEVVRYPGYVGEWKRMMRIDDLHDTKI